MRSSRLTAAALGLALVAAACGGGGSGSTQERLAAGPRSEQPAGSPGVSGELAAAPGAAPTDAVGLTMADGAGATPVVSPAPATSARPGSAPAPAGAARPASGTTATAPVAPVAAGSTPGASPSGGEQRQAAAGKPASAPGSGEVPAAPGLVDAGVRTGVTDDEVLFGMHLPQSGPVGVIVGKAWHGADAYFKAVNAAGGVHGRRVRMVVSDDGYSAQKAAGAIRDLVDSKKVFAASCLAGLDQCVVGLEYANGKGVPFIHGGMSEAAVADKPWSFPVTSSYSHGAVRLADYLFTQRGYTPARKIGAIHVNSPYYAEMAEAMEARLRHHGSKFVTRQVAEKDQSDFSASIIKMQNAGVETLWFFIDPTLVTKFVTQAKALRFNPQYVFSPPAGGELFATAAGGHLDGAFGLATFADPHWPGAATFRTEFAKAYPDDEPSEFDILSYVVAKAFVEGLRRAGPDLGRDAFARAMAAIDAFDTGVSSPITYLKRHRSAAGNSTLAVWQIKGTKTEQLTGFDF